MKEKTGKKTQGHDNTDLNDVRTFQVPFDLYKPNENIHISKYNSSKITKEEIINLAVKFHLKGDIKTAAKYYQLFINNGFEDHRIFSNYGSILKVLGKSDEAVRLLRKAIEIKPDFAEAYSNLGNIFNDFGKLNEAEIYLRKAIQLKPDFVNAYNNLGNTLRKFGKLKEAEVLLRKTIKLKPDFVNAYNNLAAILQDLGKLEEAEIFLNKAIKLEPTNNMTKNALLNLLTIYKPNNLSVNYLYLINEEFRAINIHRNNVDIITDEDSIKIYRDGLKIYNKYNLDINTSLSQIYKRNHINLNCIRHKMIFNQHKIIPEFCFGCYKVQVDVISIIELIKLFLLFNNLNLKNNNTRKCIIELRPEIPGFYKGVIYCSSVKESLYVSSQLDSQLKDNIRSDLKSIVKRGCSEYPLLFPQYKELGIPPNQVMDYEEEWRSIEIEFDMDKKDWPSPTKNIEGFNLNNFLIMRNWVAYAQRIGDESVSKITNETIKGFSAINQLNKDFNYQF